jgi:hypothetical protein
MKKISLYHLITLKELSRLKYLKITLKKVYKKKTKQIITYIKVYGLDLELLEYLWQDLLFIFITKDS